MRILSMGIPYKSKSINLQIIWFTWINASDKSKRTTVIQDYKLGGLKLIDLKTCMYSLKVTWPRRMLYMNNKCNHCAERTCPTLKHIFSNAVLITLKNV